MIMDTPRNGLPTPKFKVGHYAMTKEWDLVTVGRHREINGQWAYDVNRNPAPPIMLYEDELIPITDENVSEAISSLKAYKKHIKSKIKALENIKVITINTLND